MKKLEKKQLMLIEIIESFIFIIILCCFFLYTQNIQFYLEPIQGKKFILVTTCFILGIFICKLVLYWTMRKHFLLFTECICSSLNAIIKGEKPNLINKEDETLTGKIQLYLEHLYVSTYEIAQKREKEKQSIKDLITDISHQLKTPMANLMIYHEMLYDNQLEREKQIQFLDAIKQQIEKINFLIQNFVKMSRLDSNIIKLKKEKKYLIQTIMNALSGVLPQIEQKKIQLSIDCEEEFILLHDTIWTSEAIFNVLENAVKYTSVNGKISIKVESLIMYTKIVIEDTGIGIPSASFSKIFKRFYREDIVHDIPGFGIGLYITRKILLKQGGYIMVNSLEKKGSTFSIFLPNK